MPHNVILYLLLKVGMETTVTYTWLTCAALLQMEFFHNACKPVITGEFWQLDMHTSPQSCTEVRRAGENEAKVFIPHELVSYEDQRGKKSDCDRKFSKVIYIGHGNKVEEYCLVFGHV